VAAMEAAWEAWDTILAPAAPRAVNREDAHTAVPPATPSTWTRAFRMINRHNK